jgi:hypothetical protein
MAFVANGRLRVAHGSTVVVERQRGYESLPWSAGKIGAQLIVHAAAVDFVGALKKPLHTGSIRSVERAQQQDMHHCDEANGGGRNLGLMGTPRTPKGRANVVFARLTEEYPEALCELNHRNPFELLAATILSAQTTDVRVNMVTPALFARFPAVNDFAAVNSVLRV